MRRIYLHCGIAILALALLSSCSTGGNSSMGGSSGSTQPSQAGTVPLTLSMADTPPGVAVVSFEITLTSAVLQPGNVSLVSSPIDIEVKRLETETAFLNTTNVPVGNYSSITITFANPELTILNTSAVTIAGCAPGSACELKPSLAQASVTVSTTPFPLSIMANSPIGLLVDFNLDSAIQNDLSINPASISLTVLPAIQATGELEEIEDVSGRVTARDLINNRFTLETPQGNLTIQVDANTRFEDFDEAGLANTFSSLLPTQVVEVDLRVLAAGTLVAKKVELKETEPQGEMEGTIVSVDRSSQFKMVLVEEIPQALAVQVGNVVTVQFGTNTNFRVDNDGLELLSDLRFASSGDLLVGQNVQVRPLLTATGSSGLLVQTDRVRLTMSHFTARVSSKSGSAFLVSNLPGLFTSANPPIAQIEIRTSTGTNFEGVSGVAALNLGDTVSLRGLLFKTGGNPVLAAKKVRKR